MKTYDFRESATSRYYYILHVTGYKSRKYDAIERPAEFDMLFDNIEDANEMQNALLFNHHVVSGQTTIERQMNQMKMNFEE